jgi:uncharacterized small protein (DUF1192 family)
LQDNVKKIDSKFVLSPTERVALIESKIERAAAQLQSMIAQIDAAKRIKSLK